MVTNKSELGSNDSKKTVVAKIPNRGSSNFTRRQFFKSAGIAALVAVAMKFLPGSLLSNQVLANGECSNCWEQDYQCGCVCGVYVWSYCDCSIHCGPCPGRTDLVMLYDYYYNDITLPCCFSICQHSCPN
jgi:hypothetical protein